MSKGTDGHLTLEATGENDFPFRCPAPRFDLIRSDLRGTVYHIFVMTDMRIRPKNGNRADVYGFFPDFDEKTTSSQLEV